MSSEAGTLRHAARTWARIGCLSFGGPAGQIALMHRMLVVEKQWIDEERFLHALKFCTLLPGPEAQQLATYIGWLLHGIHGGLVAGILFVLPGALVMVGLSALYVQFGALPIAAGVLVGLKAAVLAIVLEAIVRLVRRTLKRRWQGVVAVAAFLLLALFRVPFPLIIAGAAVVGFLVSRVGPKETPAGSEAELGPPPPGLGPARIVAGLLLWWGPTAILAVILGVGNSLTQVGAFFGQTAVVTFGGAYAVLAYVAQRAVQGFGWLGPGDMVSGLALAETTPGPLILVLQFVGFLAGFRASGPLGGWLGGLLGSALTLWATFVPSILFVLIGAPYMERLRKVAALDGALTGITAAVIGVISNLSFWFAIHSLFASYVRVQGSGLDFDWPVLTSFDPVALAIAVAASIALFRFRRGVIEVVVGGALVGFLSRAVGG